MFATARRPGTPSRRRRRSRRRGSRCRGRPCPRRRWPAPTARARSLDLARLLVEHVGAEHGARGPPAFAASAGRPPCDLEHRDAVGRRAAAAISAPWISRPVKSSAWTTRRCEWPPSRPSARWAVGVAVERTPRSMANAGRARAPRARRISTMSRRQSPAHAQRVAHVGHCLGVLGIERPATPPCAKVVLASAGRPWSRPPPARARPRAVRNTGPPARNR